MQVLYVTEFTVAPAAAGVTTDDAALICMELLGAWVGGRTDPPVPADELLQDGERDLTLAYGATSRTAAWEHVRGDRAWATRLERRDVAADGSQFVTRVTIGIVEDVTHLRVSMAHQVESTGLTPTAPPTLKQPAIVSDVVTDPRLSVRAGGQVQDGRYLQVRGPDEVAELARSLAHTVRLPILLLHTRTTHAHTAAQRAASRLIGLVRVVTLDYRAARALQQHISGLDVPYAGGLLMWTDLRAPATAISSDLLNAADPDAMRADLMSRIAPLSVLTRGFDETYRHARTDAQATAARLAAERTARATDLGDTTEQIASLRAELAQASAEKAFAYDEAQRGDDENRKLQATITQLRAQVEQLSFANHFKPEHTDDSETFENAPELVVGDLDSLEQLTQHLERVTEGRITFTPEAVAAWKKANRYSTPDLMQTGLVKLARLADDLHNGTVRRPSGHFDTWVRETYDLRISMQDDAMPKGFRHLTWEGTRYDRTPHVQVNDGVPPHECGRIYFTIDTKNDRVIVSHIGLHW
ncbi:MAG: hypothetical protein HGA44_00185 [Cellulomonadaceae bacterium]|nr:hypothetical protein [Cellulomonadaceae bacterium]